jgi:RHS repeat-associated protein
MRKYDAWGQYRNDTAPAASEPKLGFTGHQYDPETGLVYARARYYDPDLGRFISRDSYEGSLSDAPSLHRYTYAHDNPLTYVDDDGHAVNLATAGAGALIGGVGGCLVGAWSGGWEGCGKGALVGAGAGAMAGLTFGASLAATGAVGVGGTAVVGGGTTGSVLVAGTMASAVGGASSGAGNVLINGGSGPEALEAAENTAFLAAVGGVVGSAVAPAIGGAVVQSTGSQALGKVAAGVAGAVVGDTAAQATAISGGVQEGFSGKQVAVAAAFGVGGALLPDGIVTPRTRTAAPAKVVVEAGGAPTTRSLPARLLVEPKLLPARTATSLAREADAMPAVARVAPSATATQRVFSVTPKGVAVSSESLAKQGTSPRAGDFTGLAGASVDEIVSRVPSGWRMVPQDKGRGIKFLDQAGVERVRLHAASPKAPAGSNSASGWTLRVQDAAGNYYDDAGSIVPYKANEGHIPIWGNPKAP